MTQDAYNFWSIILQGLTVAVSLAVAVIIYYYARETNRLRRATDDQVGLLREQARAASTPFVIPSFSTWSPAGTEFTDAPLKAVSGHLGLSLTVATASPAIDIHAILKKDGRYYYSVTILDVMPPNNPALAMRIEMIGPLAPTTLEAAIERDFGIVPGALLSEVLRPQSDHLFALFRNTKAESFLTGRQLTLLPDGTGVDWAVSLLYPRSR